MRQPNDNQDFPRWYHFIAFAVVLLVAGYALQSCAALLTPTARAIGGLLGDWLRSEDRALWLAYRRKSGAIVQYEALA